MVAGSHTEGFIALPKDGYGAALVAGEACRPPDIEFYEAIVTVNHNNFQKQSPHLVVFASQCLVSALIVVKRQDKWIGLPLIPHWGMGFYLSDFQHT